MEPFTTSGTPADPVNITQKYLAQRPCFQSPAGRAAACLAVALLGACATPGGVRVGAPFPAACRVLPAPEAPADTLRLAGAAVRRHAATLTVVDCRGAVRPGLAASWREEDGAWVFRLRPDARIADGASLTAVVAAWPPAPGFTATAAGPGTVRVRPRIAGFDVPRALADPRYTAGPPPADGRPVLRPQPPPADPRDALGRTLDLLVTRDAGVLDYARQHPALLVAPLPWDRTYVLAASVPAAPDAFRAALARDAVRGEARAAGPPPWWQAPCPPPDAPMPRPTTREPVLLYDAADPVARDLAERLVALADSAAFPEQAMFLHGLPPRTHGLPSDAFAARLVAGDAGAYVFTLPARAADGCAALVALRHQAPWLPPDPAGSLAPLVETRPHVVAVPGRVGLFTDAFGHLYLPPSGAEHPSSSPPPSPR